MSTGDNGDSQKEGQRATLKGQGSGFKALHGGLSAKERQPLEDLNQSAEQSTPQQPSPQQPYPQPPSPQPPSPQQPYPQPPYPQQPYLQQPSQPSYLQQPPPSSQQQPSGSDNQGPATPATTDERNPVLIAITRAFRSSIQPDEVTENERQALLAATPSVHDPFLQGFLCWRKSILLIVAVLLVPVSVLKIIDFASLEGMPSTWESLMLVKLIVDIAFAGAMWLLLPMWTQWKRQRRFLITLWFVYFVTPFLVFLYPWTAAVPSTNPTELFSIGALVSIYAVGSLGPKAISLMPGLMRGSITVKLLLPGSTAPGWLITLSAPIYAIFFYVILVLPYQISGSGFFVGAMIGFTGAQAWMARMGYRLAKPESKENAARIVRKVRIGFHLFNSFGALMLVIAFIDFADKLSLSAASVIELFASFIANVLLLTAIATDLLITNLHRAHQTSQNVETHQAQRELAAAMTHFDS